MKIKCPSCKKIVAETTDKFGPAKRPNGAMLTLADPWKSRGWDQVLCWTNATMCSHLFCPNCEYPLAPGGRFHFADRDLVAEAAAERQSEIEGMELPEEPGIDFLDNIQQDTIDDSEPTTETIEEKVVRCRDKDKLSWKKVGLAVGLSPEGARKKYLKKKGERHGIKKL